MNHPLLLEIACFNLQSAVTAWKAGANRVELCENYEVGGLTPSNELIREARKQIQIPLHVMVRPRAGDFIYSTQEADSMESTILFCRAQGIDGVVFGCLTSEFSVDKAVCERLIRAARPMSVTFHRAIDACRDMKLAIGDLIQMGVDRMLTSGRSASAQEGLAELKIMQNLFGKRIGIMPGGGLRSSNIDVLMTSRCAEYHTSAIIHGAHADAEEIRKIKEILTRSDN